MDGNSKVTEEVLKAFLESAKLIEAINGYNEYLGGF